MGVFLGIMSLCQTAPADKVGSACQVPALSATEFETALGTFAKTFEQLPSTGKSCEYEHPGGSSIRIRLEASGDSAKDEFSAGKEDNLQKAQAAMPKVRGVPLDDFGIPSAHGVPGLGNAAYEIGNRTSVIVHVLDRSQKNYFTVEVKIRGLSLNAGKIAKTFARSVEATMNPTDLLDREAAQVATQSASDCEAKLSATDVQRITGQSRNQYQLNLGVDGSCNYHTKMPINVARNFLFFTIKLKSRQQADAILSDLQSRSKKSAKVAGIGASSGVLPSNQLWFVTSDRKWIVTVGYYETNLNTSDPSGASPVTQSHIRDTLARALDSNLLALSPSNQ